VLAIEKSTTYNRSSVYGTTIKKKIEKKISWVRSQDDRIMTTIEKSSVLLAPKIFISRITAYREESHSKEAISI
jgi:hypothetical protein